MTVTADSDEVKSFTIQTGDNYTVKDMEITVASTAVIGKTVSIKVTSAETVNYLAGMIALLVWMIVDRTKRRR